MWNKDEAEGKAKKIKGKVKDKAGEMINDPDLEAEGEAEHIEGELQDKFGKVRRKSGEAIKEIGKKVGR
jgi:uncharacterized protein YjbJ (UPF0337 family)